MIFFSDKVLELLPFEYAPYLRYSSSMIGWSNSFALYVHFPFCIRKCPYCDFNSYAQKSSPVAEKEYLDAVKKEIKSASISALKNKTCVAIYIGGGTPSLISYKGLNDLIEAISNCFELAEDLEISLEVNPSSRANTTAKQAIENWLAAGINRISFGIQSFSDTKLNHLGRIHNAKEGHNILEAAQNAHVSNQSIDLMFGIAGETIGGWEKDLRKALAYAPAHISTYCLTISPGSKFHKLQHAGTTVTASEKKQADMYLAAQELLTGAGYNQYEVSNFALPGYECRMNLAYWTGQNYLGVGAGAHSFLSSDWDADSFTQNAEASPHGVRWSNHLTPIGYVTAVRNSGDAINELEVITTEQAELEFFLLRMRTSYGIRLDEFQNQFGRTMPDHYLDKFHNLSRQNLVILGNDSIRLTSKGFLFADLVIEELA